MAEQSLPSNNSSFNQCSFSGCDQPRKYRDWCGKHYARLYKSGELKLVRNHDSLAVRYKSTSICYYAAQARCNNPKTNYFERYGGRGIEFRFKSFDEFFHEIGPRPSLKHSLNRIDNDGHYEPGNVEWATPKQQANNSSNNRILVVDGVSHTVAEWIAITGCPGPRLRTRIRDGWCDYCAVMLPQQNSHGGAWKVCTHRKD